VSRARRRGLRRVSNRVVRDIEDDGLADHGKLGVAERVLAVMADEEMLDDGFQLCGETFMAVHGLRNGLEYPHDVAEELAFNV